MEIETEITTDHEVKSDPVVPLKTEVPHVQRAAEPIETNSELDNTELKNPKEVDESDSGDSKEHYSVERIVKKRVRGDRVQYLLKWAGYTDEDNTWEDAENLVGCQKLLEVFNQEQEAEEREAAKRIPKKRGPKPKAERENVLKKQKTDPFDGDSVEEILGARMIDNKLNLYVRWKDKKSFAFVPSEVCNGAIPHQVIEFYESRLKFDKEVHIKNLS